MHLTQIGNHMHVTNAVEQENLLDRVRSMLLDQTRIIAFFAEQLEIFHFTYIIHYLELMSKVRFHSLLDHVSPCHVAPNSSLEDLSVLLDH